VVARRLVARKGVAHEIVVFSVGSRSAVGIPGEENFILAKNMPLDGTKPDSSLLLMEASLGHSPLSEAFWPSGTAGGQPVSGRVQSMRSSCFPQAVLGKSGCPPRLLQAYAFARLLVR
jgi:hypothetical protein